MDTRRPLDGARRVSPPAGASGAPKPPPAGPVKLPLELPGAAGTSRVVSVPESPPNLADEFLASVAKLFHRLDSFRACIDCVLRFAESTAAAAAAATSAVGIVSGAVSALQACVSAC